MSQLTQLGEAELSAYACVERADGTVEFFQIIDGKNVPISAAQYAAATQEG